ncbi:uncharacterized protein LOC143592672 [Bidens hawaiensis]|uniref:uncharacterized protein LOC143592672 n=1 Tax=Bidens hawaiensis TaxID=980011 RepID=UPI004049CB9C
MLGFEPLLPLSNADNNNKGSQVGGPRTKIKSFKRLKVLDSGKNLWQKLAETFPSRTNQEIVSYYFNVFVLQRRAEQNTFDLMNADSDDDELQVSDPSEEDDDSCLNEIQEYVFSVKNLVFDYNDDMRFMFEDSKVCDVGYFSFPRSKAEFLPTGSMIEEVFGVESWNIDVADNNNNNDKG